MPAQDPYYHRKLLNEVDGERNEWLREWNRLRAAHGSWDHERDARLTLFGKAANVYEAVGISLFLIDKYLCEPLWWHHVHPNIPEPLHAKIGRNFDVFAKVGLTDLFFSVLDSSFRLYLRALDPGACKGGMAEFKSISECLLRTKLRTPIPEATGPLDLLREVRNTIHNNGVYFNKDGQSKTITFRGNNYTFEHGKPIEAPWELILMVAHDLRPIAVRIVEDENIAGYPSLILDPFE